jgi:hypothetical protein
MISRVVSEGDRRAAIVATGGPPGISGGASGRHLVNGCDESAGAGPSKLREKTARDPSRLSSHTRERVEVVQGSHGDIDLVTKAFAGADSVFWLVLPDPHAESVEADYVGFTRPACDAFKSRGSGEWLESRPWAAGQLAGRGSSGRSTRGPA